MSAPSADSRAQERTLRASAPDSLRATESSSRPTTREPVSGACPSAHGAVKFYAGRIAYWRDRMGQDRRTIAQYLSDCPRYLSHVLQRKAYGLRKAYGRYLDYQWNWEKWLPDKFARVGACETGYGRKPGRWDWDSGTYVSAFGIYRPAYEAYHHWTGHNTPREQYEVAAAIQARFGWGAWGCGGA